jgi:hypothetical protein
MRLARAPKDEDTALAEVDKVVAEADTAVVEVDKVVAEADTAAAGVEKVVAEGVADEDQFKRR